MSTAQNHCEGIGRLLQYTRCPKERASQISRASHGSDGKDGTVEVKPAATPRRRRRVMSVLLAPVRGAREYVRHRRDERKEAQLRAAQQAYERNRQGTQV